jgi:predicted nucleic acid-binding protein
LIVVLDADVLIAALDATDTHHRRARQHFKTWRAERAQRVISLVTLTEVLVAPAANLTHLNTAREAIAALEVKPHTPNEAIAVDAARLCGKYPISLPDAYVLATARHVGGRIASFDPLLLHAAAQDRLIGG